MHLSFSRSPLLRFFALSFPHSTFIAPALQQHATPLNHSLWDITLSLRNLRRNILQCSTGLPETCKKVSQTPVGGKRITLTKVLSKAAFMILHQKAPTCVRFPTPHCTAAFCSTSPGLGSRQFFSSSPSHVPPAALRVRVSAPLLQSFNIARPMFGEFRGFIHVRFKSRSS